MNEKLLQAAEEVVNARKALAEAEARFQSLAGNGRGARSAGRPTTNARTATNAAKPSRSTVSVTDVPVAQMVAKLFEGDKKYLFADIIAAAGGREKRFAVKSALNKLRAKGEVKLANGYYQRKA